MTASTRQVAPGQCQERQTAGERLMLPGSKPKGPRDQRWPGATAEEQQAASPIPAKGHRAAADCPKEGSTSAVEARGSKAATAAMPSLGLIGFTAAGAGRLRIKCHVFSSKKNHSAEHKRSPQNKDAEPPAVWGG